MKSYTDYAYYAELSGMTVDEYIKFFEENGPKPDYYEVDDLYEPSIDLI